MKHATGICLPRLEGQTRATELARAPLGRTALRVSRIGFGAATLGEEYGRLDVEEGRRAVDCAIDHGIDFFDVSPYYGRTLAETRLGEYLQGKRERVILATKVGRYDRDFPNGFDFSAERVVRSAEQSLRRLRTDVIDLFLAHDIEFARPEIILGETLPAMRRLQDQGKVRYVGVTGYPLELLRHVAERTDLDVILSYCHYSLLNTRLERVLAPVARERGIGLINASPLHMGALTRHGAPEWHPAPDAVLRAARAAAEYCEREGADLAELALGFALAGPAEVTLVGFRSDREVQASLRALASEPDPKVLAGVKRMLEPVADYEWSDGLPGNAPPADGA